MARLTRDQFELFIHFKVEFSFEHIFIFVFQNYRKEGRKENMYLAQHPLLSQGTNSAIKNDIIQFPWSKMMVRRVWCSVNLPTPVRVNLPTFDRRFYAVRSYEPLEYLFHCNFSPHSHFWFKVLFCLFFLTFQCLSETLLSCLWLL